MVEERAEESGLNVFQDNLFQSFASKTITPTDGSRGGGDGRLGGFSPTQTARRASNHIVYEIMESINLPIYKAKFTLIIIQNEP